MKIDVVEDVRPRHLRQLFCDTYALPSEMIEGLVGMV